MLERTLSDKDEQARQVSRLKSRRAVTAAVLARLGSPGGAARTSLDRQFLIRSLGFLDPEVSHEDRTSIDHVRQALGEGSRLIPFEELQCWISAAAQLEASHPGAFAAPALDSMLDSLSGRYGTGGLVGAEVAKAWRFLRIVRGEETLPDPNTASEDYLDIVGQVGDWVASSASSGVSWTEYLLDRAVPSAQSPEGEPLSDHQQAFVLEQLGLLAWPDAPDPERPDRTPVRFLEQALSAPSDSAIRPGAPPEAETQMRRAIAAATSLARIGRASQAPVFFARRKVAGENSLFFWRTRVAAALHPIDAWPEPRDIDGWLLRFETRFARVTTQREADEALGDLRRAIDLAPRDPRVLDAQANLVSQQALGQWGNVRELMANGRPEDAARADAAFLELAGQAVDLWGQAILAEPENALWQLHRGEFLYNTHYYQHMNPPGGEPRMRRFNEWRKLSQDALQIAYDLGRSSGTDATHGRAGTLLGMTISGDRCVQLLREATEENPYLLQAWYFLGNCGWGDVIDYYTKALGIDPYFEMAYMARADRWASAERFDKAVEDYSSLIQINPDNLGLFIRRGEFRLRGGDLGAIEDFQRVLDAYPRDPRALRGKADALARKGQTQEAVQVYMQALQGMGSDLGQWVETKDRLYATLGDQSQPLVSTEFQGPPPGLPQVPSPLVPGRFVGRWSAGETVRLTFRGAKGRKVRLVVQSHAGDPALSIQGPDGSWRVDNDDRAPARTDSEVSAELPADGTYQVEVRSKGGPSNGTWMLEFALE